MTTNTHINLKKNTISYLSSNFFWNLGRTIPHAILTILLIDLGLSLEKIAFLQIVYMIAVMLLEFPSGIMSDYWSRKGMFIISIILILISYFIIYVSEGNFYLLMISWFLYGTSTAAKSGSLESELVNQINKENKSIKKFSVWDSYLLSISSSIGAIIGSLFYERIHQNIYLISFILFFLSIIFSSIFSIKKEKVQTKKIKKKPFSFKDIKKDILYFSRNSVLTEIIILFTLLSLFLQPFFQYWQVLYENKHISITYFGYVYFIFQICNIIGTYLFETITYKRNISYIILGIISISSLITLTFLEGITFFIAFPIILCTYYIYYQYLLVELRENSPEDSISTLNSLIGTMMNISSIIVLLIISVILKYFSIETMYNSLFLAFSVLSISILILNTKKMPIKQKNTKTSNI